MLNNIRKDGYFVRADVYSPLFNKEVSVTMDAEDHIGYAESCITYFNAFSDDLIVRLCEASIRYRDFFLEYIGEELIVYESARDVLNHITPLTFTIPNPENGDEPVLHMELNCEWETEHGMEWIVRGDKVLYVGGYDGIDPWGDFTKEDEWNYA